MSEANSQDLLSITTLLYLSTDAANSDIAGRHCSTHQKAEHSDTFNSQSIKS